jgi:hypothetical protein
LFFVDTDVGVGAPAAAKVVHILRESVRIGVRLRYCYSWYRSRGPGPGWTGTIIAKGTPGQ